MDASSELRLREVQDADLETFFAFHSDPEANRMVGFVARPRASFFEHWAKASADPAVRRRSILSGGRLAGYVGSFNRGDDREVCYWLGREFWGKGLATRALVEFLKGERSRPLYARVADRNPASVRVVEKAGFSRVRPDRYVNEAGEAIDEFVFRLK
ncbi:MAG: GNAT family N-acetyltransferase [Elusimicrobia bacterium]|nr:GNAT family N-acetyltransferase [Elusimicrobiota bacterium]